MAQGIILAGGFSSRAKTNKMMLEIDGQPLLVHTINSMKPYVSKIILVTGHYDQQIRSFINEDDKIKIVYNQDYEKGMFSSVLCGVKEVDDDFFIIPGDIPFVSGSTYLKLLTGEKMLRYPIYQGHEGHPLFLKKELIKLLLQEDKNSNLRLFRDKQDKEKIDVDDKYILSDIDSIDDYQQLLKERKQA